VMCQVIEYSNICIDTQLKTTIVVFLWLIFD